MKHTFKSEKYRFIIYSKGMFKTHITTVTNPYGRQNGLDSARVLGYMSECDLMHNLDEETYEALIDWINTRVDIKPL